ncbi:hypothetical protein JCM3774_003843 [Rhodotorula dairenensis]
MSSASHLDSAGNGVAASAPLSARPDQVELSLGSALQVHILRVSQAFPDDEHSADEGKGPAGPLAPLLPLLETESQQDVGRFRFLRDAKRCLLGRLARRFVASERLGLPWPDIAFRKAARGRPELILARGANPRFDFNVSHDNDLVAVASVAFPQETPMRVGVDIMRIKDPWEDTALDELIEGLAEHLSEDELLSLKAIEDEQGRLERVLALWTLKEAYVKATGDGLHVDLKQIRLHFDSHAPIAYCTSLSTAHALLHEKPATGWRFLLQKLRLDDSPEGRASYWVAVAVQGSDGEGEILVGSDEQQYLNITSLTLEDILRNARRAT